MAGIAACLVPILCAAGCRTSVPPPPSGTAAPAPFRERVAALALRQVAFGSVSLLPVRFDHARLAGPFEEGGRTLYCVSSRMHGRSLTGYERARTVIREEIGTERLSIVEDEWEEVCSGRHGAPFSELETLGNRG